MSKPTPSSNQPHFESAEEYWSTYWPAASEETGDKPLYEYAYRDGTGNWVLDHPGYEDDE